MNTFFVCIIFVFLNICNGNFTKLFNNNTNSTDKKYLKEIIHMNNAEMLKCYSYIHGYSQTIDTDLHEEQCNSIGDKCVTTNQTINDVTKIWNGCASDYCKFRNITFNPNNYAKDECSLSLAVLLNESYSFLICSCSHNLCNRNGGSSLIFISQLYLPILIFTIFLKQFL